MGRVTKRKGLCGALRDGHAIRVLMRREAKLTDCRRKLDEYVVGEFVIHKFRSFSWMFILKIVQFHNLWFR